MLSTDQVLACGSTWLYVAMREEDWQCMVAHDFTAETSGGACGHEGFEEDDFSQKSKLERVLSNGAICGLIGEAKVVVAVRQLSLMY